LIHSLQDHDTFSSGLITTVSTKKDRLSFGKPVQAVHGIRIYRSKDRRYR
jgi:hypothetical protein